MKDLESGLSNKEVVAKYGAPKTHSQPGLKAEQNVLLHWNNVVIKKKIMNDYERVNDVVFKWFLSKSNHDIPIDCVFIKEKALQYAKELGFEEFQASDAWLRL